MLKLGEVAVGLMAIRHTPLADRCHKRGGCVCAWKNRLFTIRCPVRTMNGARSEYAQGSRCAGRDITWLILTTPWPESTFGHIYPALMPDCRKGSSPGRMIFRTGAFRVGFGVISKNGRMPSDLDQSVW